MRIGWGYDAHRLGGDPPLLLAGVVVDESTGLEGTSDADVAAHAVADALLGAAALGDLGTLFPSSDGRFAGADSMALLAQVVERIRSTGLRPTGVDLTIVAEEVRIAPHRRAMRDGLAAVLGLPVDRVSVKATSTDGLGWIGRREGIAAAAVASLGD